MIALMWAGAAVAALGLLAYLAGEDGRVLEAAGTVLIVVGVLLWLAGAATTGATLGGLP